MCATIMLWQPLNSIILWVAVLCSTGVVSDELDKSELANTLNMLVQRPGWSLMGDVRVVLNQTTGDKVNAMSGILEAVSSRRKPVDEINVMQRYKEIWTILSCKYAEIIITYKVLIQNLIMVCQNEKYKNMSVSSFQKYYQCFRSVLIKLHSTTHNFEFMRDTLELFFSLRSQSNKKPAIILATKKLSEFSSTIGPKTSSKLTQNGTNVDTVDYELRYINNFMFKVLSNNVYHYAGRFCDIPKRKGTTAWHLINEFYQKKIDQLIPEETTILQYVLDEINVYVADILNKWFYDLGFGFDFKRKVIIRENPNIVNTEIPNDNVDDQTYMIK